MKYKIRDLILSRQSTDEKHYSPFLQQKYNCASLPPNQCRDNEHSQVAPGIIDEIDLFCYRGGRRVIIYLFVHNIKHGTHNTQICVYGRLVEAILFEQILCELVLQKEMYLRIQTLSYLGIWNFDLARKGERETYYTCTHNSDTQRVSCTYIFLPNIIINNLSQFSAD